MEALEEKMSYRHISNDELIELALLNIEPGHDGFRAIEVLREISAESVHYDLARLWIAYCNIYELMDQDALRESITLCEGLIERGASSKLQAAGLFLKASALRELDINSAPVEQLLESIRLEPTWIAPRQFLAKIYQERGDQSSAEYQLQKAIAVARSKPGSVNFADQIFEQLITAQGSSLIIKRLQNQLHRLREGKVW